MVTYGALQDFKDDESVRFLQDPDVTNKFSNCQTLSDVNPKDYDAVFYVGGRALTPVPEQPFVKVITAYRTRTCYRSLEGP